MGVTVQGLIETDAMLARVDMDTKKRVTSKMYAKAQQIQKVAKDMAPVDEGNLEESIKINPPTPGRNRDEQGRFVRQEIEVYIDMDAPVPERPGKRVGDYAYEIHEHLTPVGPKQLGPKSREKQNSSPEQVGGHFLTRAMEKVADGIVGELAIDLFGG